MAVILPTLQGLTERQYQLFFLFQNVVAQTEPVGFTALTDHDVEEAADAVAASLETAARGVIYEKRPPSPVGQRLAEGFTTLLQQVREHGTTIYDREAAIALRAIQAGARDTSKEIGTGPTAYLDLMARLLQVNKAQAAAAGADNTKPTQSPIILP